MSENIVFQSKAYCKIILHAAKYPHCTVNGVLLAKITSSKSKAVTYEDAIPLFHIDYNLTPMAEIALAQIDELASKRDLCIAGYYIAHENMGDNSLDNSECKITEKISMNINHPCLVVVNNPNFGLYDEAPLKVAQFTDGAYRQCDNQRIQFKPEKCLATCYELLDNEQYTMLNDFDNHLDNVNLDWWNPEINKEIEKLL